MELHFWWTFISDKYVPVGSSTTLTYFEREADGELPVVGHPDERHRRRQDGEGPAADHDVGGVTQRETLVEVHGVRDRVVPLQGDDGQREHAQLGAHDAEKSGDLEASRCSVTDSQRL